MIGMKEQSNYLVLVELNERWTLECLGFAIDETGRIFCAWKGSKKRSYLYYEEREKIGTFKRRRFRFLLLFYF